MKLIKCGKILCLQPKNEKSPEKQLSMTLKKIVLVCQDDVSYTVEKEVAFHSQVIRNLVEDLDPQDEKYEIPIPNVDSGTLSLVLTWCLQESTYPQDDCECSNDHIALNDSDELTDVDNSDGESMFLDSESDLEFITPHTIRETQCQSIEPQRNPEYIAWDANFLHNHQESIYSIIIAADYLNIAILRRVSIHYLANELNKKSFLQIRSTLRNDWSLCDNH